MIGSPFSISPRPSPPSPQPRYLKPALERPPYEIIYPSFHDIGLSLLRTCIGILILLATRAIVKLTVFWGLKLTFTIDDKSKESLKVLRVMRYE